MKKTNAPPPLEVNEGKYTPGPWFVERPSVNTMKFSVYAGTEVKPTWIADIYTARNRDEGNAYLIASAPQLKADNEALKEEVKEYNKLCEDYLMESNRLRSANRELLEALKNLADLSKYHYKEMNSFKEAKKAISKHSKQTT